jgi:hypothetical protein
MTPVPPMFILRIQDHSGDMDAIVFDEDAKEFFAGLSKGDGNDIWRSLIKAIEIQHVTGNVCLKSYEVYLNGIKSRRYRICDTKLTPIDQIASRND